jgi:hypothetical protein
VASAPRGDPIESTQTSNAEKFRTVASGSLLQKLLFYFGWANSHNEVPVKTGFSVTYLQNRERNAATAILFVPAWYD